MSAARSSGRPSDRPQAEDGQLRAALPYVPRVLAESLATQRTSRFPWSDEADGTLVMADISGFTSMSERLARAGREGAEQLTDIITSFFTSMLDKARLHDGDIITYGGDAMLLLFTGKGHERRAVAASLDMLDAMRELPPYRVGRARIRLGMSMGAHSDRFPIFGAGAPRRAQFLILGPATVRTAECEALANPGELVVSAETHVRSKGMHATQVGEGMLRVDSLDHRPAQSASSKPQATALCSVEKLLPYLPPFVADSIACETEPPALDSDHRRVSIVFVNVLGVDALLSEGRDVLAEQLQAYVAVLLDVLERHEGYLVSNDIYTDGFKLIIAFGAPIAVEDDAEKAVRFSIELRNGIEAAGLRLRHRIGVNRGDVFAGDVGPEYRRQYTVMGDAVNLSARLMSAAKSGTAMTTCEVARTAGEGFSSTVLSPIRVKGKSEPIDVCLLDAEIVAHQETVSVSGQGPFVGRDAEMAALAEAEARASKGEFRLVTVLGEPGMGKSRLVAEGVTRLRETGWQVIYGMSYQHTSAMPFRPWVQALTGLMRLHGCTSTEASAARVRDTVQRFAPSLGDLACLVGQLLDVPVAETDQSRTLDAMSRRHALFDIVRSIVRGSAAAAPVCLVFEDLHWADASSLDLLAHVASGLPSEGQKLLVLGTGRVETPTVGPLRDISTDVVDLPPLADAAALALVSSLLGVEVPAPFATTLLSKSRGNPLFLQEVTRGIVQTGALQRIGSASSAVALEEALASIDIPDRVQSVLLSRVDRLSPGQRELLRTASVIGVVFALDDVLAIAEERFTDGGATTLRDRFDELVALEFFEPSLEEADTSPQLRFAQPLLQEVTYNSVRFARRRALHRTFAQHLEQLPQQETRLGALVLHYWRAGELTKTSLYGVKAADYAARLFAHREAVDYSRLALGAIRGSTPIATWERSCIVERIGDEHELWGHHREAIRAFKDALRRWVRVEGNPAWAPPDTALAALLDETPRSLKRAVLCRKIAWSYEQVGRRYDLAEEWADQALAALPEACAAERARILVLKGVLATRGGRFEDTVRFGQEALEQAASCGDPATRALALNTLWHGYDGMGDLDRAIECALESVSILEDLGDLPRLPVVHGNLANCYAALGQFSAARRENEIALELDERLGLVGSAVMSRVNLTEILACQGCFDEARACLTEAFEGCEEIGAVGLTGYAYLMSARIYAGQGALEAAQTDLKRAIELLTRANARGPLLEAYIYEASLALQSGDLKRTARAIERAQREDKELRTKHLSVRLDRVRGVFASRQRRFSDAHESLDRSIELARRIEAQYELALSILAMADVAALAPKQSDQWPERRSADDFLAEAIPLLRDSGAEADLRRAYELQDRLRIQSLGESALARALAESGAPQAHIEAGTLVMAEGETGHEMYLIRSGVVRAFHGSGIDEFTLGLLGPGDFFGEMSLIGHAQRSASVLAVTDVDVITVDSQRFDEIVSDPVGQEIISRASGRMRELGERAGEPGTLRRPPRARASEREIGPSSER